MWRGLEQSLIDDAVDWPTACVLVFVPMVDIFNIPCDCQFVFSVYLMFDSTLDAVGNET